MKLADVRERLEEVNALMTRLDRQNANVAESLNGNAFLRGLSTGPAYIARESAQWERHYQRRMADLEAERRALKAEEYELMRRAS